jgi:hypothetical protein
MPHYFFDVGDGHLAIVDEDGTELSGSDEARSEAARILAELGRDRVTASRARQLSVAVRDKGGPVLRTTLTFDMEPLNPPSSET